MPKNLTLFCLVDIKQRSFFISCVFFKICFDMNNPIWTQLPLSLVFCVQGGGDGVKTTGCALLFELGQPG